MEIYFLHFFSKKKSKGFLSDIISVLAMTAGAENQRESLKYRLSGSTEPVESWGHEYVR